ncbi:MAG: ankyrin repeat domain-containing protein [Verrucomicrobiota bacterium]
MSRRHTKLSFLLASLFTGLAAIASDLPDAAERQDWARVASLLAGKTGLNDAQADGATALHWAAYHDRADMVAQLLASGAPAQVVNRYGITPLVLACQNGNEEIVKALLKAGADVHAVQKGGETALMIAARTGRPGAVKAMLEHGAKMDAEDHNGQTALMWAAADGHADAVNLLIRQGADWKHRLKSGFTALLFVAREGKLSAVQALLAAGADPNDVITTPNKTGGREAPNGTSALILAVENGHFEVAMALVKGGADPNDQRSGFTALHTLTWVRKPPRGDDEAGQPPPETTGKITALEFIREMVTAGANVNATVEAHSKSRSFGSIRASGATPFLLACETADLQMMKKLVELGANPHLANADASTPLMAAAGLGCTAPDEDAGTEDECVIACEYLISLGADVNTVDRHGQTAMHGAAYKNLPKVVKLLSAKGAKIDVWNQPNDRGWTPLLIAQGFRPGNFKPSVPTVDAISEVMHAHGVQPAPAPDRGTVLKKPGYEAP